MPWMLTQARHLAQFTLPSSNVDLDLRWGPSQSHFDSRYRNPLSVSATQLAFVCTRTEIHPKFDIDLVVGS
jgi:hypothetical protein